MALATAKHRWLLSNKSLQGDLHDCVCVLMCTYTSHYVCVCVAVHPPGHPNWSGQLCDQSVLRLAALADRRGPGRRLGARVRQENGPQRVVGNTHAHTHTYMHVHSNKNPQCYAAHIICVITTKPDEDLN